MLKLPICGDIKTSHLTVLSTVPHGTGTAVCTQAIGARASIFTGLGDTLVQLVLTEFPRKTRAATAGKCVDVIDASPIIQTWAETIVYSLSLFCCHEVHGSNHLGRTNVQTQVVWILCWYGDSPLGALRDLVLTLDSIKARTAHAHKAVDVVLADAPVSAGLAGALVYLSLTALSFKTQTTEAGETGNSVQTCASMQTRV